MKHKDLDKLLETIRQDIVSGKAQCKPVIIEVNPSQVYGVGGPEAFLTEPYTRVEYIIRIG